MKQTRREVLGGVGAFLAALGWDGCVSVPADGETLAPWAPGMLDLHFIYTGCGENMFYRLPDGTAILNDVGEFYRPKNLDEVPLLPSAERLGGDWVTRYLQRVYPERTIDYAVFSHWHSDHIGHSQGRQEEGRWDDEPAAAYRWRTGRSGERINGFRCVTEEFRIGQCFCPEYPARNAYATADSSLPLLAAWLEAEKARGVTVEPFRPGALNQLALRRDPTSYASTFSIRNISANGVIWDGRDGTVDLAGEHVAVTHKRRVQQNALSTTFVMRYGAFSYFASGDLQTQVFRRADGTSVDLETAVGKLLGPVTVCKMGHHGCANAMGDGLVKAVRSDAYVASMWCPSQSHPKVMDRLRSVGSASGRSPLIVPQLMTRLQRAWFAEMGIELPHPGAVHVVVRVPSASASAYQVHLLDARDESPRVIARFTRPL